MQPLVCITRWPEIPHESTQTNKVLGWILSITIVDHINRENEREVERARERERGGGEEEMEGESSQ